MATAWLSVSYSSCDALSSLERLTKQQISTRHIIAQIGRKNIIFYHSKASSDFEKKRTRLFSYTVLDFFGKLCILTHTQTGFTKSVLGISEALLTSIPLAILQHD